MTTPDELRDRIAALDPERDRSIEPVTGASARHLLEEIMSTPLDQLDDAATSRPPSTSPSAGPTTGRATPRRWWLGAGAAAAIVAAIAIGVAVVGDGGSEPEIAGGETLELSTGDADPALMSCLPVSAEVVADSPIAFRGIVQTIDGERVTLTVDRWYAGGDADLVEITAPAGLEALIGSVDWVVGEPFLVTAWDGVVNYCGFSGPATPELQSVFDTAFPG